jgi:hypothetical protein
MPPSSFPAFLRLVYLDNDQDMELNGAKPDFIVLPQPKLIKATQRKP